MAPRNLLSLVPLVLASRGHSFAPSETRTTRASDLVKSLIEEKKCFSTPDGVAALIEKCDDGVVFEDRFEKSPIVGKDDLRSHLLGRISEGKEVRIDQLSDGDAKCGFTWTWTAPAKGKEGLRGTSFVELDEAGERIAYMSEFPEPLFKPGDLTVGLLKAVTKGATWPSEWPEVEKKTPATASEIAKYLYADLQLAERKAATDELERFWDDEVYYHDLNYKVPFRGPKQVRKLVEDFTFPGIEFRICRIDDGVKSTCFMWDVVLHNSPESIQGITFLKLDDEGKKIVYVRDLPESAFKPPILGRLARKLRPRLGTFRSTTLGSRPGGL